MNPIVISFSLNRLKYLQNMLSSASASYLPTGNFPTLCTAGENTPAFCFSKGNNPFCKKKSWLFQNATASASGSFTKSFCHLAKFLYSITSSSSAGACTEKYSLCNCSQSSLQV